MTLGEFFGKFKSLSLWANLIGMVLFLVVLALGFKYGLDIFTHHGERIVVPKLYHMNEKDAEHILDDLGLEMQVVDTAYFKKLKPGIILEQSIPAGDMVKGGRVIYVKINATEVPTLTLPDIIDNSSLREAMAKLSGMGFKLGQPQFIAGEKDWVYGVTVNGKHVVYGDKIPIEAVLIIQVGNGMRNAADSVFYTDPIFEGEEEVKPRRVYTAPEDEGEETEDDFEEIPETPEVQGTPQPETPQAPATKSEEPKPAA